MEQAKHPAIDFFLKDISALQPGLVFEYKKALIVEVFGTIEDASKWCVDNGAALIINTDEALVNIGVPNASNEGPAHATVPLD